MFKKLSFKHSLFPEKRSDLRIDLSRNLKHTAKDMIVNNKNKSEFITNTDILDKFIDPDSKINTKDMKYSKAK